MDEKEIMKVYREKLAAGLKAGNLKIDDIERIMGETMGQFRASMLAQTEEIIGQSKPTEDTPICPDCGMPLKKTD